MKNNYEKSEKPGRIIIENSLFCEIDEECIYRKNQGMDRHRTDEYTINENAMKEDVINEDIMKKDAMKEDVINEDIMKKDAMKEDVINEDITDGHNSDNSNID